MSTTPAYTVQAAETPIVVSFPVSDTPDPVEEVVVDYSHMPIADVQTLIAKYAQPLGVSEYSMFKTIQCETPKNADGTWNALGQSLHYQRGVREDSWGLVQIHLPSHPKVSKEQAQTPEFAIQFMAEHFANDKARLWTCWRELKAKGVI
jgi:hypothetical protein